MKSLLVITLQLFLISLIFSSCGVSNKITYSKEIKKPLKKVEKEANAVVQTYFIHSNDSIYQTFNISAVKKNNQITFSGNVMAMDSIKLEVYNEMKGKTKILIEDSVKRVNANQGHIYVNQLHLSSSNRFVIEESNTLQYERYTSERGKFPGLPKWLSITLTALFGIIVIVVAFMGLLFLLFFGFSA
jgi:hypothetical protein